MITDWIEWQGGECPVDGITEVDVILRSGYSFFQIADCLEWAHHGTKLDIILYHVHVSDAARIADLEADDALHRSFPEAGDGRPMPPMGDELMIAGLSMKDARFVAAQLAKGGWALIKAEGRS
jgi:hypothetical protein